MSEVVCIRINAGPDYKYPSDIVMLAIYIFCRTVLPYVLICGFPFFPNLTRLIGVRYLYV